jgi:hypothetical protein
MTWIDDDSGELNRRKHWLSQEESRNWSIVAEAEKIYNDLWSEITDRIAEAKQKNIVTLLTNGSTFHRKIIAPTTLKGSEPWTAPKEVLIDLSKDKLSIIVSGLEGFSFLPFFQREDNVILLNRAGEYITVAELAKLILRPLLFPELFGPR